MGQLCTFERSARNIAAAAPAAPVGKWARRQYAQIRATDAARSDRSSEAIMSESTRKRGANSAMTLALVALLIPLEVSAQARLSSANVFGQCATQRNVDLKIASCTEASKATSFPWILRWVHRELARAHRERGETDRAIINYARSLAAQEDERVRAEMESLSHLLTQ
jgi:hypothetical protein